MVHVFRVRKGVHYAYTLCLILLSYGLPSIQKYRRSPTQRGRSDLFQQDPPLIPTSECITQCEYELNIAYLYILYTLVCIAQNPVYCFHMLITYGTGISILTGLPIPYVPPIALCITVPVFFLERNLRIQ